MCIRDRETTGPDATKNYFTYQFEGAGQVIFTTTNDWASPDMKKLNGTAEPVSYTHLDVYKRQAGGIRIPAPLRLAVRPI